MFKVNPYPAILEKSKKGYSVLFPDLPGAISAGKDYESAVKNAKECLSLHLYGMLQDKDPIPAPSHVSDLIKELDKGDLIALVEADIFAVKAQQEDKAVRVNITLPRSLLDAIDAKARQLHLNRSSLIQKAALEAI
jgi:predicted RNase H-like HicB family nuclease